MKIFKLCALSFCILASLKARAESYKLNQLIDLALKNSSILKANELEIKSNEQLANQATTWVNPYLEMSSENRQEIGGETKSYRIGLSQTFFTQDKYKFKGKVIEHESDILKIKANINKQNVLEKIISLIFQVKINQEKLIHTQERLLRLKTVEKFLKSRNFVSPQKKAEASIVEGKLLILQKEIALISLDKENLWTELNSYLKLETEPLLQISWFKYGPELTFEKLSTGFYTNNPNLKILDKKIEQTLSELNLIKAEALPSLTVSGFYSDGAGFSPEKIYGVGLSIPLPVFNRNYSGQAAIEFKSKAEIERSQFLKEQSLKDLKIEFSHFEYSKKLVQTLPVKKIAELEKSIMVTDQSFKKGQVDLLTYLEADDQHFLTLSAILEAQLNLVDSLVQLQSLTGLPMTYEDN